MRKIQLCCLSHWFPKIRDAGLPVPKTEIVTTDLPLPAMLEGSFVYPHGLGEFHDKLRAAAEKLGYPCFLRTGHGSGKHRWRDTCYLASEDDIPQHVTALVEWSETVNILSLPSSVWAVRELLPTSPIYELPLYGGMPLCREFRVFVKDGGIQCIHPYWPWEAVVNGCSFKATGDKWHSEAIRNIPADLRERWEMMCVLDETTETTLTDLACRAAQVVEGDWSIDFLETARGWYLTDIALAQYSWHWPGCPHGCTRPCGGTASSRRSC